MLDERETNFTYIEQQTKTIGNAGSERVILKTPNLCCPREVPANTN